MYKKKHYVFNTNFILTPNHVYKINNELNFQSGVWSTDIDFLLNSLRQTLDGKKFQNGVLQHSVVLFTRFSCNNNK